MKLLTPRTLRLVLASITTTKQRPRITDGQGLRQFAPLAIVSANRLLQLVNIFALLDRSCFELVQVFTDLVQVLAGSDGHLP